MTFGTAASMTGGILVAVLIVLVVGAFLTYGRLSRLRSQADTAWEQIDAQLRRRYDLIPSLVDTVRRYGLHDRGTIAALILARENAITEAQSGTLAARAAAEDALTDAVTRLVGVGEAYPDLRSNPTFSGVQVELRMAADKLAYAKQQFNMAAESYNEVVRSLATRPIAMIGGFRKRDSFRVVEGVPAPW